MNLNFGQLPNKQVQQDAFADHFEDNKVESRI